VCSHIKTDIKACIHMTARVHELVFYASRYPIAYVEIRHRQEVRELKPKTFVHDMAVYDLSDEHEVRRYIDC